MRLNHPAFACALHSENTDNVGYGEYSLQQTCSFMDGLLGEQQVRNMPNMQNNMHNMPKNMQKICKKYAKYM